MRQKRLYQNYVKRLLDIVLSSFALVILSPVLLITAMLVRIKLGSPIVFRQVRPGMREKLFCLYKFRSMTNEKGEDGRLLPDTQRLTRFGKFLRASSLDELPELVNIIKGEMSIVGPRPLSIYYLPHYSENQRKRQNVRPGLTGLAQVNGRNNLPWDERFSLDVKYTEQMSFRLDLKIILDTALKVVRRADVSVRGTTKVLDFGPYHILQEEKNGGRKTAGMTYSEIGSYFWLSPLQSKDRADELEWLPSMEDSCFTFSGRNAIDLALRDILNCGRIRKVYVPSYCCISMLQSFVDHGIKLEYYEVNYNDGAFRYDIPEAGSCDAVLIMGYFGINTAAVHDAVKVLHKRGATIIEDITHSLLSHTPAAEESDYVVASLRKWFAIPAGGWIGKRNGSLYVKPCLDSNHAVEEKISGMREKYSYLSGAIDSKEHFLLTLAKFENDLIHVDRMLKLDDMSMKILAEEDVSSVIVRRRQNAGVLIEGLKDIDGEVLQLPVTDLNLDTPLFLPVMLKTELRDSLRQYLIDQGVYCPVHWPEIMGAPVGVRANELSLICDQRYTGDDMKAIVDHIHNWVQNCI